MANKNEVRGVQAKRKKPLVIPQPYAPENQHISKAEFLKRRAAFKAANAAADEARSRVLAQAGVGVTAVEPKEIKEPETILKLRKALANAESKLQENPDSKTWKKKVFELSEELEAAEAESLN